MKIYDLVKTILITEPQARNSDKLLIWEVYKKIGIVEVDQYNFFGKETISRANFLNGKLISSESITRARRKVQELHPELEATDFEVRRLRQQKEATKGAFIYAK